MNELFPRYRIGRVRQLVDAKAVPVPNGANATWAFDNENRYWVRKRIVNTGVESLFAECVGWLFGDTLGLRQPRAALFEAEDGWSWLSERVPNATHWSSELRDRIANLDEVGAMLALDAILLNEDRHAANILVQPSVGDQVLLWAIDCGNALVSYPDDFTDTQRPSVRNHARGLPVPALRLGALRAAELASRLERAKLEAFIDEAVAVAEEPRGHEILELLCERCQSAVAIVNDHLDNLERLF
ncbi:MAG: hypothetical protein RBU37_16065 [Myxococcota bacterium]|jgi:hypothetical protein|nr:hypothetical protein [Myxococcota bacterium]